MRLRDCLILCCVLVLVHVLPGDGEATIVNNTTEAQKPVQLTGASFDSEIRRVPSSQRLLVEYYAHWYALQTSLLIANMP